MRMIKEFREPGRGILFFLFDRIIICLIAFFLFIFSHAFCRVKIKGKDNMPHSGAILCIANHPSTIGIFALLYSVFWPWVLQSMSMVPIVVAKWKYVRLTGPLRLIWRHFNVIAIKEKSEAGKRSKTVEAEVKILTKIPDCVLWFFAEGTRTDFCNGFLNQFRSGVGRVVAEARPDIVFVWDNGSNLACPKGKWPRWQIKRFWGIFPCPYRHQMTVSISKPISAADPSTGLYRICEAGPPEIVAEKVASYLNDLCWAFAVFINPELELDKNRTINTAVISDVLRIIG